VINSPFNRIVVYFQLSGPLGHGLCFAVVGYHAIVATIVLLLSLRCPAHVTGLVAHRVVDSVERILRTWTWRAFREKYREVIAPGLMHAYAATPIDMPEGVVRVGTALHYRSIQRVHLRRLAARRLMTMFVIHPQFIAV
jgi:hypothetical protein